MAGLTKLRTPQDLHSVPESSTKQDLLSDEGFDLPLTQEPDRKLRNQIILVNIAAWMVIGLVFSYFFL